MFSLLGEVAEELKRILLPEVILVLAITIQLIVDFFVVLVILGIITILDIIVRATGNVDDNWIHMILQFSRTVTFILYIFMSLNSIRVLIKEKTNTQ